MRGFMYGVDGQTKMNDIEGYHQQSTSHLGAPGQPDMGLLYGQLPPPHVDHVAPGFLVGVPDHIQAAIDANPAPTATLETHRLWRIINHLTDHVRVLTLKYDDIRRKEDAQVSPRRAANNPGDPFMGDSKKGINPRHLPAEMPKTPTQGNSPTEPPPVDAARSVGRQKTRHKRTETPEQLHLKPYIREPVYTVGIDPQSTRGLLHDYFEDIRRWAGFHIWNVNIAEMHKCSAVSDVIDALRGMSDVQHMLADSEMRKDILSGLIIRHIVVYALGESGLFQSQHDAGALCNQLCRDFSGLEANAFELKHKICLEQRDLYNKLKQDRVKHKQWRTRAAEQRTQELLSQLSGIIEPGTHPERDHRLTELYVKGYRIGFRLRMEAVKWQLVWPVPGTDVSLQCMVNQTRNLFGDPSTTLRKLIDDPQNFFVRFALTPTFIRSDFSSGSEVKEVVHSSLVHVGVRGSYSHLDDARVCRMG